MASVEINDEDKMSLKVFKRGYEKRWGKILWKDFMDLIVNEIVFGTHKPQDYELLPVAECEV